MAPAAPAWPRPPSCASLTSVLVYGIASSVSHDVEDFYPTAAEAKATLAEILADEPELEGSLWVEPLEIDVSLN
jgi:hypothetical protein